MNTGEGYNGHSNLPVHFGLPDTDEVHVEVTFLTAAGRKTQRYENIRLADFVGKSLNIQQQ